MDTVEIMPQVPLEIQKTIALLRSEAQEKNALADALERTYGLTPVKFKRLDQPKPSIDEAEPVSAPELTVDAIRARIRQQGSRPKNLAQYFNVPVDEIMKVLESKDSNLVVAERGWVKEIPESLL